MNWLSFSIGAIAGILVVVVIERILSIIGGLMS